MTGEIVLKAGSTPGAPGTGQGSLWIDDQYMLHLLSALGFDSNLVTGWFAGNETWTYSSVDDPIGVITISGNVTGKYSAGMRIKFTNGGNTIYGIIAVTPVYSSPNTTITFLHEIDPSDNQAKNLMANSAITANYYSLYKAPQGFPLEETKWSIEVKNSDDNYKASAVSGSWYYSDLGSISITIPIGSWKVTYSTQCTVGGDSAGYAWGFVALSTSNNSVSDVYFQTMHGLQKAETSTTITQTYNHHHLTRPMVLASKTTYYLIYKVVSDGSSLIVKKLSSSYVPTSIRALCAYL